MHSRRCRNLYQLWRQRLQLSPDSPAELPGDIPARSDEIEAIGVHDLGPGGDEVGYELLLF
jgi:hypothetical protein